MTPKRRLYAVVNPYENVEVEFVSTHDPEELFYRFSGYSTEKVRRNVRDGFRVVTFEEVIEDKAASEVE